ncbi:Degradation activator [Actinomyces bovis]|uniref:Degradation activator n=1 Tax=Actinomyces bovis TaxID=1658 RepID=A0ABY1VJX6_9ACTO|nr:LacI family DNA-binding transcriptional regulator [Actinomyces bovis]SPT52411.1 Degradation activator [Actinomyces bovis]VEG54030.1 Degradation activator [Actinomyces israelii]
MNSDAIARRPTLQDVAEATGTSISTVSRALNGSPRVGAQTRDRIREEANRIGYQVDLAGSLLRRSSPRNVGLICRLEQELHSELHDQMLARAEAIGLNLVVQSVSQNNPASRAIQALEQLRCQAVVVVDPSQLPELRPESVRMPLIAVGQDAPTGAAALVTSDNRVGMQQLVAHLWEHQHREVRLLDGPAGASADARRKAFEEASTQVGLSYRVVAAGASADAGYQATRGLLERGELQQDSGPSALVCYNDQCAQGAYVALLRGGQRPGQDISVTGCDDSQIAISKAFDLTSINRQPAKLASLAVELAGKWMGPTRQAAAAPERCKVNTKLVVRGSSGPAPRK